MKKTIKNAMSSLTAKLAALLFAFTCAGTAWGALSGTGTSADPFTIATLADLQEFRDNVNAGSTYKDQYVKLTADIDLNNEEWMPIGTNCDAVYFSGTFDGENHTISNLFIDQSDETPVYRAAGFFGAIRGTVKRLKITNATVTGVSLGRSSDGATVNGIAVAVGSMAYGGTIDNVSIENATVVGNRYVAGIVGYVKGTVENCTIKNVSIVAEPDKLTGSYDNGDKAGGIVGYCNGAVTIKNNTIAEDFDIRGYRDIAGIVGCGGSGTTLVGNSVADDATVTVTIDQVTGNYGTKTANAGVLAGRVNGATGENGGAIDDSNSVSSSAMTKTATAVAVAQIGTVQYGTLEAATRAYQSGDTIEIIGDASSMTAPEGWVINPGTPATLSVDPMTTWTKVADGFYQSAEKYVVGNGMDIYITSKAGLEYFRDLVNGVTGVADVYASTYWNSSSTVAQWYSNNIFNGMTVHLMTDIDLGNEEWAPIGQPQNALNTKCYFYGHFNGENHTISNLKATQYTEATKTWYAGLFGMIGAPAGQTISNLTINNVTLIGYDYAGAIVGNAGSNPTAFNNCHVTGNIDIKCMMTGAFVGGIVGIGTSAITDCSVEGSAGSTIEGSTVGGLAGTSTRSANASANTVAGSTVTGVTVNSEDNGGQAGGLVGKATNPVTVTGNTVHDVTVSAENGKADALVGGVGGDVTASSNTTDTNVTVISDPITGSGTAEDPYIIPNLDALKVFRDRVNGGTTYQNKFVKMADNLEIDLASEGSWTPIGNKVNVFKGTFDGNGVIFRNLTINDSALNYAGLFGFMAPGTLKNINIVNVNISANNCIGAIAGGTQGSTYIDNCTVTGTINLSGNHYIGGISGWSYANTTDCLVDGGNAATSFIHGADLTANSGDGDDIGGIIGFAGEAHNKISGCTVKNVTIEGFRQVGGIAGIARVGKTIENCTVENVVVKCIADEYTTQNKASKMAFGGIVGVVDPSTGANDAVTISGCVVSGVSLESTETGKAVARMGYVSGGRYNTAEFTITDADNVSISNTTVENCTRVEGTLSPVNDPGYIDGPYAARIGNLKYDTLAAALADVTKDAPLTWVSEDAWPVATPVYYNGNFYAVAGTTQNGGGALDHAIAQANTDHASSTDVALIYVRPGYTQTAGNEGAGTFLATYNKHQPFASNIIIYGNNASLGGEAWEPSVTGMTRDMSVAIYNLHDGAGIWGQHNTPYVLTATMENCNNVHEYMVNGSEGSAESIANVTIKNCTFGTRNNVVVASTNPGTVVIDGCTFTENNNNYVVNINNKNGGTTTATISNSTFNGGGTASKGVVRVNGEVEGTTMSGTFENLTFNDTSSAVADIQIGHATEAADNKANISYTVSGTTGVLKVFETGSTTLKNDGETAIVAANNYSGNNKPAVAQIGSTKYTTLAEALLAAQDGDVIEILDGTWGADAIAYDSLTLNEKLAIRTKSLTIQAASGASPKFMSNVTLGYDDSSTRNATITVKGLAFENAQLQIGNYAQTTVENCSFTNAWLRVIESCASNYNRTDFIVDQVTIRNCTFNGTASGEPAIRVRNGGNVLITGNTIANSSHNGILLESNSTVNTQVAKTVVIQNNTINEWNAGDIAEGGRGIRADLGTMAEGSTVAITGNTFRKDPVGLDSPDFAKITNVGSGTVDLSGNDWNDMLLSEVKGNSAIYSSDSASAPVIDSVITTKKEPVAQIGTTKYPTLAAAIAAAQDGDTIEILAAEISEGSITFPATMKNVTIKAADGVTPTLKDMVLNSATGSAVDYEGITIDGLVFDNSRLLFTGRRTSVVYKDWAIVNCTFTNIVASGNYAAVQFGNFTADKESMNGFTFTNNVIDGVSGSSNSGLNVNSLSGDVLIEGNLITNVAWNALQLMNGVEGATLMITNNLLSSKATEGVINLSNNKAQIAIVENAIIGDGEGVANIAYPSTTIDASSNYWGGGEPTLYEAQTGGNLLWHSYYTTYTDTADWFTLSNPIVFVAQIVRNDAVVAQYASLAAAFEAAQDGDTVLLLKDIALNEGLSVAGESAQYGAFIDKSITIDGNGYTITSTVTRAIGVKGASESEKVDVTFKDLTVRNAADSAVCIITRGGIGDLVLDGVTLDTNGTTVPYNQPLTIGGTQSSAANVTIKDSVIKTNDQATQYYAVLLWNPVDMVVTNSTIMGWACLYFKDGSAGSTVEVVDSTLVSKGLPGSSNHFAAIVAEDDDITVNVTGTQINITAAEGTYQGIALPSFNDDIDINLGEGNTVTLTGEKAVIGFNANEGDVEVSGGTFNVPVPEEFCADGYIPAPQDSETGLYTVKTGSYVAAVGGTGYVRVSEPVSEASDDVYLDMWGFWGMEGMVDADGNACPQYVSITDNTMYRDTGVTDEGGAEAWVSAKYIFDNYLATGKPYAGYQTAVLYEEGIVPREKFETLGDAIVAAQDSDTVQLLTNITLTAGVEVVKDQGGTFVLDGAGYTITAASPLSNSKIIAVYIEGKASDASAMQLDVKNLTIESDGLKYGFVLDSMQVAMSNVVVRANGGTAFCANTHASVTIDDCTIANTGSHTESWRDTALAVSYMADVTVNSGTFTSENGWAAYIFTSGGTIDVKGGTFSGKVRSSADTVGENRGDATITISGGEFSNVELTTAHDSNLNATIAVSGGWFSAQVPAMACAEGFEPTGALADAPNAAVPYTVGYAGDIIYPIEGTAGVRIALAWATNNTSVVSEGAPVTAADVPNIITALGANGANGMPKWESYVLGLDPKSATSQLRLAATAKNATTVTVTGSIDTTKIPSISNMTVTFRLAARNDDGTWTDIATGAATPSFDVALDAVAGKVLAIFADIVTE